MRAFPFQKYEGLGNDFIVVDLLAQDSNEANEFTIRQWQQSAMALCQRRLGIGADGVLLILPPSHQKCTAKMVVLNHDGSRPEMCGNGLRCVAHQLKIQHFAKLSRIAIETDAGIKDCEIEQSSEQYAEIRVNMGPAQALGEYQSTHAPGRRFINVSMGNPHAVSFVDSTEDPQALAQSLGALIEVDPRYPNRTNVEFAKCHEGYIELWVWERGCGITQACGTGACATAAAALWTGRIQADEIHTLQLPGGQLRISFGPSPKQELIMAGPSRKVFVGSLEI